MSTETPRTNEAERTAPWPLSGQQGAWKFARTIERELTAAKAAIAAQNQEIERLTATIAAKDEAIKRLNGWLDNDRRALGEEG